MFTPFFSFVFFDLGFQYRETQKTDLGFHFVINRQSTDVGFASDVVCKQVRLLVVSLIVVLRYHDDYSCLFVVDRFLEL